MSIDVGTSIPGIWKRSDIQGGQACIRDHRIPVWILVNLKQHGANDDEILRSYPSLTAPDLAAAWKYYAANTVEIDGEIAKNDADDRSQIVCEGGLTA
jgi:uncharacterized protein (DUF433 family)